MDKLIYIESEIKYLNIYILKQYLLIIYILIINY